jgi:hypothetical protein
VSSAASRLVPPESDAARFFLSMKSETTADLNASALPSRERTTARIERREIVEQLLLDVRRTLEARPESPARRTLVGKLRRLDSVVARWSALPPNADQLTAMVDILHRLQEDGRLGV